MILKGTFTAAVTLQIVTKYTAPAEIRFYKLKNQIISGQYELEEIGSDSKLKSIKLNNMPEIQFLTNVGREDYYTIVDRLTKGLESKLVGLDPTPIIDSDRYTFPAPLFIESTFMIGEVITERTIIRLFEAEMLWFDTTSSTDE